MLILFLDKLYLDVSPISLMKHTDYNHHQPMTDDDYNMYVL